MRILQLLPPVADRPEAILARGRKPESKLRVAENYFRRYRDGKVKVTLPRVRCLEEEAAA